MCGDYSYLPENWTEAVVFTGQGKNIGSGLVGANGNQKYFEDNRQDRRRIRQQYVTGV